MSARKMLWGVAIAVLLVGHHAAAANSCFPAFFEVDVKDGLKVQADCGFHVRALNRMATELSRAAKDAKLSRAQIVSLARAANVILSVVVQAQSDDTSIATAFADTLEEQCEFERAEPIYRALLSRYQVLAQEKPAAYQPQRAHTQQKLGNLYVGLQRPKEAEIAYLRALEIDWALARQDPVVYGPAVAETFDSLGVLYRDTQRLQDATDAYRESLDIDRALADRDPTTYKPDIATTLNDLGILYDAHSARAMLRRRIARR
ncbi:tetratricopeptide repeat protein [Paraburkholderia phenazinium]|nr:tetratricopeptide repeat protein [Paraburkholderia phenazinium]